MQWGPGVPNPQGPYEIFYSSFPEEQKYGFPKIPHPHPMFPEVPEEQNQAYSMLKWIIFVPTKYNLNATSYNFDLQLKNILKSPPSKGILQMH